VSTTPDLFDSQHESEFAPRVAANSRLTSATGAVIFVLLFAEGITILQVGRLLTPHVFIGLMLIPPVLLKVATTGWRLVRYYSGDRDFVRRGPPHLILRLLGPFVVVLTVVVIASGMALVFTHAMRSQMLLVHKASFILWLGAMTIHVLGHIIETATLAPRDWFARSRRQVAGASRRQWVLVASVVAGVILAVLLTPYASNFFVG